MDIQLPNVITTLKKPEYNFTFRVIAYRHLSEQEMNSILKRWMRQKRQKNIPKNKTVTYRTIIGFDDI